jgi:hypothetical protein
VSALHPRLASLTAAVLHHRQLDLLDLGEPFLLGRQDMIDPYLADAGFRVRP